jgi:hypothetical protein
MQEVVSGRKQRGKNYEQMLWVNDKCFTVDKNTFNCDWEGLILTFRKEHTCSALMF